MLGGVRQLLFDLFHNLPEGGSVEGVCVPAGPHDLIPAQQQQQKENTKSFRRLQFGTNPPSHASHLKLTFGWVQTPGDPFCIPLLSVCRTWRPQAYQDRDCFLHSAGRLRCISTSEKGSRSQANMNKHRVEFWTYRVRRFPTAKCHRTTRRSQTCTRIRRCFLETST